MHSAIEMDVVRPGVRMDSTTSRSRVAATTDDPSPPRRPAAAADHKLLPTSKKGQEYAAGYEKNVKGLKRIALVMDVTTVCNWALGFCALTWASAVLLGAYVGDLSVWQYYDVSVLLFVEGLRFAVAALLRTVGIYRLSLSMRSLLRSAGIFIPLWMGGFALLSLLPPPITQRIGNHFLPQRSLVEAAPYKSLTASLTIFYSFILANALVLLLGRFISCLMRLLYVNHSGYPSIHKYHDKMLVDSSGWMQAGIDLDYAFQMQSFEYKRRGTAAKEVCKDYADLIGWLYMHEKGVEAVEAALGAEDVYVREAAANIVGFFAVLEELQPEDVWKHKKNVPLCYQKGMLSKLADLAAGGYGPTSTAAARSFALLLEANRGKAEMIGMLLGRVQNAEKEGLEDILLQRYQEMVDAETICSMSIQLQQNSDGHLYALGKLLLHSGRSSDEQRPEYAPTGAEARRAQQINELRKEILGAADEEEIELPRHREHHLILSAYHLNVSDAYYVDIKAALEAADADEGFWKHYLKIGIFLLVNVALPLTLGFIVRAYLMRH